MEALAKLYKQAGRYGDAVPLLEELLEHARAAQPPDNDFTVELLSRLATAREGQQKPSLAEPLWGEAVALCRKAHGPDHELVALTLTRLGHCRLQQKQYAEA